MAEHDILIIWDPSLEDDFDYYLVYQSTDMVNFTAVGKTKQPHYTDKNMPVGTYYYSITATDKEGNESSPSTPITKTSPMDVIAPSTPTGLSARRLEDYSGVNLFWEENTEEDLKGYIIYRTYDGVTYHIAAMISSNSYKDDDIPRSIDPLLDATYVAYAVAAYDKSNNVSVSTAPIGFFTIPTIRNFKVSLDYLSLNISWRTPLYEDNISSVSVWYKKKVDTAWIYIDSLDWPTSRTYLEGPLDKDTEYDVAIGTHISASYNITSIHQGLKYFKILGNHASEFPPGAVLRVTGSTGNDGQYTITDATYNGTLNATFITVAESIPHATADGSLFCFTLQVPILRAVIPDYEEDTTPPTNPWGLAGRQDPKNDRIYLSWNRVTVDDDFLRYEILTRETDAPDNIFILHGKSSDNSYILNDAPWHVRPDNNVYVKVRAIDRSGNVSAEVSLTVPWYSVDISSSDDYKPQWVMYTEDYYTTFKHATSRKYSLTVNDAAEQALFFRRHVLFMVQKANVTPYKDHFNLDGEEILAIITGNQLTFGRFQDVDKSIVAASAPGNYVDISGDWSWFYNSGDLIVISGCSATPNNNGVWTINTVVHSAGVTRLSVTTSLPSSTTEGQVDAYIILIWPGVEDWFGGTYVVVDGSSILMIINT